MGPWKLFRPLRPVVVLVATLLVLLPATRAVRAADPVTLRIGVVHTASETGLNPFDATDELDYTLIANVYDLVVDFGPHLEPAPGLAETWDHSADGKTWTYHIRDGVTWQDGQPLTADDIAFTFNYIRESQDPDYKGPAAPDGNDLAGAEDQGQAPKPDGDADNPITLFDNALDLDGGFANTRITSVETTDPRTLVIKTTAPLVVLNQLFIPVVPKHIWQTVKYADVANFKNDNPIGSGPFIVKQFQHDQVVQLDANTSYWAGAPKVDRLVYQYFDNGEASVAALQKGDIDMLMQVPPTLADKLKADANITVVNAPSSDFGELGFNSWNPTPKRFKAEGCGDCPKGPTNGSMGNPWLTKPEVRAALAQLIDKQDLVDRAFNGYAVPGNSIVGPFNDTYYYQPPADDPARYPGSSDGARARFNAVMSGLGFADTDGNGILNVPDTADARAFDPKGAGKDWNLRLFVRDDDEEDKVAGELIQSSFEAAGVSVDRQLIKQDPGLYNATYPSSSNADMDMYIWGWGPDPDPDFILSVFACKQINNWQDVNFCDPAYDKLYSQSRLATDLTQRAQIVKQLQAKAYTESPYAVLWYVDPLEAYRSDRWTGFEALPSGKGDIWTAWGFGPYGSQLSVAPVGAAGAPAAGGSSAAPGGSGSAGSAPGSTAGAPGSTSAPSTPVAAASGGAVAAVPQAGTTPAPVQAAPGPAPGSGGTNDSTPMLVGVVALVLAAGVAILLFSRRRARREEE